MGRDEGGDLAASQIFYPCMQCADIFHLQADVTQLGLDQRKVNVLALEYCDILKKEQKPCILSSRKSKLISLRYDSWTRRNENVQE